MSEENQKPAVPAVPVPPQNTAPAAESAAPPQGTVPAAESAAQPQNTAPAAESAAQPQNTAPARRARYAPEHPLFSSEALRKLILPLIAEQLLLVTVGMADTVMVAGVGQAAVSGVSLVDQINQLLIQVFAALATGGAVVASQYLGRRETDGACRSARQLFYLTAALSCAIMVLCLALGEHLLAVVFGATDADVMANAVTYFWLSALSYPFIAVYNAGAALFRSMGNSRISLIASLIMNILNIGGNALLIFGFNMGVAGAAIASLVSRAVAAIMVIALLHTEKNPIRLTGLRHVHFEGGIVRSILRVGVPSGVENSMFHIGKLLVLSLVSTFGVTAIAANAVCNNIGSAVNIPGNAIGLSLITVVGQCVGAKDFPQARWYTRRMMIYAQVGMALTVGTVLLCLPWFVGIYALPPETTALSIEVARYFCVCTALFWPASFALPNTLRAAGDARFTMAVSMVSMWLCRVLMSYVLGVWMHMGLLGIWVAMTLDWVVRDIIFIARYRGKKWEQKRVITG